MRCSGVAVVVGVLLGAGSVLAPTAVAQTVYGPSTLVVASVPDPTDPNANGNDVQTFDLATGATAPVATATTGPYPYALAITPDGSTAYVADAESGQVTPIAVASDSAETALCLPVGDCASPDAGTEPEGVAVLPDGSAAYVVNSGENSLSAVSLSNGVAKVMAPPITGAGLSDPDAIAITPSGSTAWVANYASGTVVPVTLATGAVGSPVAVGSGPTSVAITPNGDQLIVADSDSASVSVLDLQSSPAAVTTIPIDPKGAQTAVPEAVAVNPDGASAEVTDAANDELVPINLRSLQAGSGGSVCASGGYCGAFPAAVAIAPDGDTAYVGDLDADQVSVMQLGAESSSSAAPAAPQRTGDLATDGSPDALAVTPGQAPSAAFSASAGVVDAASSFDASASSAPPDGGALTYSWNFGDGGTQTTTSPQTTHVYTTPGTYTVTLTVSDASGTAASVVYTGQTVSREGDESAAATQTLTVTAPTVDAQAIVAGANGTALPVGLEPSSPPSASVGSPTAVGSDPVAVAIAPDGRTGYVLDNAGDALTPIDLATGQAAAAADWVTVGSEPDALALSSDGRYGYVVDAGSSSLTRVTLASGATATIPVKAAAGADLDAIAVAPGNAEAYVTDAVNDTVTPVDLATATAGAAVGASGLDAPDAIAILPAGGWAYVVDGGSATRAGGLTAVSLSGTKPVPERTLGLGGPGDHPDAIAIAANGKTAYVVDAPSNGDPPTVTAVSLSGATMSAHPAVSVNAATGLAAIAISPNGASAFATGSASSGGVLIPLTLGTTPVAESAVALPSAGTGVAIAPDQAPDARLTVSKTRLAAGGTVTATANGSSSGPVPLQQLSFGFGDGTKAISQSPALLSARHRYTVAGTFTLTLTATDADGTAASPIGDGQTLMRDGDADAKATQKITVYPTLKRLGRRSARPRTKLTIRGTGFSTKATATVVRFGTVKATKVRCESTTRCTVTVPVVNQRGRRTVTVSVTVGGQHSPTVRADRFTVGRPR